MTARLPLVLAVTALGAAAAPAVAVAGWSAPRVIDRTVGFQHGFSPSGGMLLYGDFNDVFARTRSGAGFGAPEPVFTAPETETLMGTGIDASDRVLLMTVRQHEPYERVRIVLRDTDGTQSPARTISGKGHSATQPRLSVAPDGTAVAAWGWHDTAGWRVQAAVRKPGEAFGPAQTLSAPTPKTRPWVNVAAGEGGHAAIAWHVGGDARTAGTDLLAATAGPEGSFSTPTRLDGGAGFFHTTLAVAPDGRALAAWLPTYYMERGDREPGVLKVADAPAGGAFGPARTLSSGGPGFVEQGNPVSVLTPDGGAVIAWAKPIAVGHTKGVVEAFARPPGGSFGRRQVLTDGRRSPGGLTLSAGSEGTVALGWNDGHFATDYDGPNWESRVSVRTPGARAFPPAERISDPAHNGLWPSVTVAPDGTVLAAWTFNDDGSGAGPVAAAVRTP